MNDLHDVKTQFKALRQKIRQGSLFQSIGEVLADQLQTIKLADVTQVVLPQNGDVVLNKINQYRDDLAYNERNDITILGDEFIKTDELELIVAQLANPLPEYRDYGAFSFLGDLIQKELLSSEQMRWLINYLMADEHLFTHIFESENDAIYQRSFSLLLISLLLFVERTKVSFMTGQQLNDVVINVAVYAALERDTRGYVDNKGWAHAFTHIGNAVAELLMMPNLIRADKLLILACVMAGYRELKHPLVMGETERLVEVTMYAAAKHEIYCDYVLLTMKLWRKDLVTKQGSQNEGQWHQLYNRSRFFNAIILSGEENVPQTIYQYVNQIKDF